MRISPYSLCALTLCSLTACSINAPGAIGEGITSEALQRYAGGSVLQGNSGELGRSPLGYPIVACREALTSAQPNDDAHP